LSGGQRQRVAIGRAIVREPQVFLFDEPLSNLDAALRQTMRVELSKLHRELGTTMIYVTHDQVEAMTLADRIVVFDGGIVQQVGTPAALYERPANLFVAGFLGAPRINLLPAALLAHAQGAATVGVRPEHWQIVGADGPDDDALDTRVELVEYLGDHRLVYLRMAGLRDALCLKQAHAAAPLQPGDAVRVRVPREHTLQFDIAGRALS
jgi:multiple sugar transport system ATP-binding protein